MVKRSPSLATGECVNEGRGFSGAAEVCSARHAAPADC